MSTPKLEDLPKVAVDLKSQLEGFSTDNLKDTVTQEKIVLPTAEGKNIKYFLLIFFFIHMLINFIQLLTIPLKNYDFFLYF